MPWFEMSGYGRETGKPRNRRYWGINENEALDHASADATVVETIVTLPPDMPTEAQLKYARDLGLRFPSDITCQGMSDLLSCHLDDDVPAPAWLRDYARELGLRGNIDDLSEYVGKRQLYDSVTAVLAQRGDQALAIWFVYHVHRNISRSESDDPRQCGLPPHSAEAVAATLVSDPRLLKSLKRYRASEILHFGEWVEDGDHLLLTHGSKNTLRIQGSSKALGSRLGRVSPASGRTPSARGPFVTSCLRGEKANQRTAQSKRPWPSRKKSPNKPLARYASSMV